jgi:hypothetical protein
MCGVLFDPEMEEAYSSETLTDIPRTTRSVIQKNESHAIPSPIIFLNT